MPSKYQYQILDALKSPAAIRKMSFKKMYQLADDIRNRINEVVTESGGHLGPNLGAVETIIALHHTFNLKKDRLIFDVGHQAYPHKLITGRHNLFTKLRKKNGISGYPCQHESSYDVFRSGHASTSISTALGLLEGYRKNHKYKNRKVIAFIGDGALGGGMAFEALNHAGHLKKNLIVLLNDNHMSISPTVGALSANLNRILHNKLVKGASKELIEFIKKIPRFGNKLTYMLAAAENEIKHFVNPGQIFTDLGFDYLGPVDGHNLKKLINTMQHTKKINKPLLIHVCTIKGKGYKPHGRNSTGIIGPHALSGNKKNDALIAAHNLPSYSEYFADTLTRLAHKNKTITAITAAMAEGTKLIKFKNKFPKRFYDVGICEQHGLGFAAGLAKSGLKPVFALYSTFFQRTIDQLFHEFILQEEFSAVICLDRAGLVGDDGPSHHGIYDIALLRHFPDIILAAPKNGPELKMMLQYALRQRQTVIIRYPKEKIPAAELLPACAPVKTGAFEYLVKGGKICLFAYGSMVIRAVKAAQKLKQNNINVSVVNARFAKPLAKQKIIKLAQKHKYIITLEEGTVINGLGTGIGEIINQVKNTGIIKMGIPDQLIKQASREEQLEQCGLTVNAIIKTVKNLKK
ncbi:MAG TPA: 1-deoxy-D-xylulose-5-phosphate synthase [Spirochaetota bacterium]|nr:1-deoxy-D-xylulose-5-phosphate synthase [Spirochaetota bacterium]